MSKDHTPHAVPAAPAPDLNSTDDDVVDAVVVPAEQIALIPAAAKDDKHHDDEDRDGDNSSSDAHIRRHKKIRTITASLATALYRQTKRSHEPTHYLVTTCKDVHDYEASVPPLPQYDGNARNQAKRIKLYDPNTDKRFLLPKKESEAILDSLRIKGKHVPRSDLMALRVCAANANKDGDPVI